PRSTDDGTPWYPQLSPGRPRRNDAVRFASAPVMARWTGRPEGDLGPGATGNGPGSQGRPSGPAAAALELRRRALVDRSWSWVTQVHGAGVVVVHEPGDAGGAQADALVSDHPASCLAVF